MAAPDNEGTIDPKDLGLNPEDFLEPGKLELTKSEREALESNNESKVPDGW